MIKFLNREIGIIVAKHRKTVSKKQRSTRAKESQGEPRRAKESIKSAGLGGQFMLLQIDS
jgi:hypothetical protein